MSSIESNVLVFRFPEIHEKAVLRVKFHRTLRIPDDNRDYPLPPSLGNFPLEHVDDFADKLPEEFSKRGGIMMPMWQSEAMWLSFESDCGYPFAVKIAAGKINAVSGEQWNEELLVSDPPVSRRIALDDETSKDYMTVPKQKWIDGFHIDAKRIRQFVAMALGDGYTAEEQLTGKAEFGGVQIIAYPMKAEEALKHMHFPSVTRGFAKGLLGSGGDEGYWGGICNALLC